MKIVYSAMMSLALLLSGCKFDNVSINEGRRIDPSQNIVKKEFKMDAFDKVVTDVVANVKFIQSSGDDYRVVLSAPDNYIELFTFKVNRHELEVSHGRQGINIDAEHVDVTIYSPTLRKLENSGLSNVEIDRLTTNEFDVENSGVGSLYLSGLAVTKLDAECSGVGSMELSGTAEEVELDCSGVGSIKAERLKAKNVKADVSGVGGIKCYASERINAEVSGVGSLKYGGNPKDKQLQRSGVGSISEL